MRRALFTRGWGLGSREPCVSREEMWQIHVVLGTRGRDRGRRRLRSVWWTSCCGLQTRIGLMGVGEGEERRMVGGKGERRKRIFGLSGFPNSNKYPS